MAIRSSEQLVVVDHPLAQHKLALIRDRTTTTRDFRWLMGELAAFLCYEATRDLEVEQIDVETPLETARGAQISGKKLGVVAVLRAGLGMLDAVLDLVPVARVGFVGIYRDEATLEPVEYYCKLPGDLDERDVLVLDPMLATGGSASAALGLCKQRGSRSIRLLSVVAAPIGLERIAADHPDVTVYTAASTASSTKTASSCPAWATRATGCSARGKGSGTARHRRDAAVTAPWLLAAPTPRTRGSGRATAPGAILVEQPEPLEAQVLSWQATGRPSGDSSTTATHVGVRPGLRARDSARRTSRLEEIGLGLEDARPISRVEEVAGEPVSSVEHLGVQHVEPVHPGGNVRVRRPQDEVVVVRHEAIRVALPVESPDDVAEDGEEQLAIIVVEHDWEFSDPSGPAW